MMFYQSAPRLIFKRQRSSLITPLFECFGKRFCTFTTNDPEERSLRAKILEASVPYINEHGWTKLALSAGAEQCNLPGTLHGMFEDPGTSLVFFLYRKFNRQLRQEMSIEDVTGSTRSNVSKYMRKRLEYVVPYRSRWPEAMTILARPDNVPEASRLLLSLCDDIWYHVGDRSVDFSWYTKRLPLMGVYMATQLHIIQDKSENFQDSWEFMERRLDDIVSCGTVLEQAQSCVMMTGSIAYSTYHTIRNIAGFNDI